jgi:mannose-1-phosphate guanylyltransferase
MEQNSPKLHTGFMTLKESNSPEQYEAAYLALEDIAIDYALIEKVPDLLVVPAAFDWMDLGSYADLHKAALSDEAGNHRLGDNIELDSVENSFIENHENKPLAVIGLDNIVVVNTPNGIVVARKDMSKEIGAAAKRIQAKSAD